MQRTLTGIGALASALLLTGCLSIGHDFPVAKAESLRIGETTQQEVQEAFGNPMMTGVADGNRSWTYVRVRYSPFGGANAQYLEVQFDERGNLASYSVNQTPSATSAGAPPDSQTGR